MFDFAGRCSTTGAGLVHNKGWQHVNAIFHPFLFQTILSGKADTMSVPSNKVFHLFVSCRSVVGELDEELDAHLDLSSLRAHPLKPVIHWSDTRKLNQCRTCDGLSTSERKCVWSWCAQWWVIYCSNCYCSKISYYYCRVGSNYSVFYWCLISLSTLQL